MTTLTLPSHARAATPGGLAFAGWAARFDVVDRAGDVFRRGAFAMMRDAPLLVQHRGPAVGIVVFNEEEAGLRVVGEIDDIRIADLVRRDALSGLSVGYRALRTRQGAWREILRAELIEVSLVAQPMQPGARVTDIYFANNPLDLLQREKVG